MRNPKVLALFGTFCIGGGALSGAAAQQMFVMQPQQQMMMVPQQQMVMMPQQQMMMTPQQQQQMMAQQMQFQHQQRAGNQFISPGAVAQMPNAAHPTRVTGALPRVGSNVNATGRQYFIPSAYDRLSDSGLYIGLSVAYTTTVNGGIQADYMGEQDAWTVPGAFRRGAFRHDTVIPLQFSVGAAINSDIRIDFSYTRYSGISYPGMVGASAGPGNNDFTDVRATGGNITSSATMLNLFYNLDSYTGHFAGGALRPYVGVGLGISTNTISDYLLFDPTFYAEVPTGAPNPPGPPFLTGVSNIYAYHAGGTRENLAWMIEGGVTTEMDGGVKIDFFVRYMGLGRVQSSGSIVVSQTEWLSTGVGVIGQDGSEAPALYDSVFHYTNWKEGGTLRALDLGVRLRIQF
jgi:hypothetical protein